MADQAMHAYQESTTHSERVTYVIEHPSSWRQHLSCDLNQVLSLRDSARPTPARGARPDAASSDRSSVAATVSALPPIEYAGSARDTKDLPQRHDAMEGPADLHEQNTHR